MKHAPTRRDKKALYSTAKKTIEMKFFWIIELYRRLLETLSSSETKKLKISKVVRYKIWNVSLRVERTVYRTVPTNG